MTPKVISDSEEHNNKSKDNKSDKSINNKSKDAENKSINIALGENKKPKKTKKVTATGANKKVKKEIDPDKFALDLIELMRNSYNADASRDKSNLNTFELKKLTHLNEICNKLLNTKYQEKCLFHGVLHQVKMYLEPYADKSLPNIQIKKQLLTTLTHMKCITRADLSSSQIGKIVHFYSKNPRENMEIRRIAKHCVSKWKGMIIAEENEERMMEVE